MCDLVKVCDCTIYIYDYYCKTQVLPFVSKVINDFMWKTQDVI